MVRCFYKIVGHATLIIVVFVAYRFLSSDPNPPEFLSRRALFEDAVEGIFGGSDSEPAHAGDEPGGTLFIVDCNQLRTAGLAPADRDDPVYTEFLDREGDGVYCADGEDHIVINGAHPG